MAVTADERAMIEGRHFAGAGLVGARKRQEDAWAVLKDPRGEAGASVELLAVVADGLGGHSAGDQASRAAVEGLLEGFRRSQGSAGERLREALLAGNAALREAKLRPPRRERWKIMDMGTTVVAAAFTGTACAWISVGDSLIFRCRDGTPELLNPLHTEGARLDRKAAAGVISWDRARSDPYRQLMTSAVLGGRIEEISEGRALLEAGDVVVLASDGIETLAAETVAAVCGDHREGGAAGIAQALLDRIRAVGHERQDNATVVVVLPGSGDAEPGPCKNRGLVSHARAGDRAPPGRLTPVPGEGRVRTVLGMVESRLKPALHEGSPGRARGARPDLKVSAQKE